MIVVVACFLSVGATAQDSWVTDDQYAEMQKNFAESTIAKTPMRWLRHLLVQDGDRATIMEKTVTIAAPGQ